MEENTNNTQAATSSNGQTVIINQQVRKTNGIGIAGFILALISLLICWIPILSWVLWVLGAIFSFVGLFKTPRGAGNRRNNNIRSNFGHSDSVHSRSNGPYKSLGL